MSVYINYRKSVSHRNQTMTLDAYAAWPAVVFAAPSDDTQIAGRLFGHLKWRTSTN